jgi:hypothetical protein
VNCANRAKKVAQLAQFVTVGAVGVVWRSFGAVHAKSGAVHAKSGAVPLLHMAHFAAKIDGMR